MNFKLKALAAALAVVAAAPVLAAPIADGSTGNSDLVMSAWDPVALTSYTMNLNMKLNSFTGASSLSFAPDANMATFLGKVTPGNILWNVLAVDSTGSPNVGGDINALTTAAVTPTGNNIPQNPYLAAGTTQENTYFGSVNNLIPNSGDGNTPTLGTGNSVVHTSTSGTDFAYAGSGVAGDKFGGKFKFSNAGALDQSLNFYKISSTTGTNLTKATVSPFTGGTWTLSSNGALNYAAVAAVPVPAAVWLFVSGLLGLVGVSRRKSTHV